MPVAGLPLRAIAERLTQAYARTRRDFELDVSLGKLRQVRLTVTGRVGRPGPLTVPAWASLLEVLSLAGGVLEEGSLRRIVIHRAGTRETVDLYRVLLDGPSQDWPRIRAGDRIHVPEIGPTLAVAGLVRRPGIYELPAESLSLGEALALAGGLTPFSFSPRAQVEGSDGRRRVLRDLPLDEAGRAARLRDGELLLIGAVEGEVPLVRLQGEAVRPGNFQHRAGLRVSDLLTRAEGLTLEAAPEGFLSRRLERGHGTRSLRVIDLARALGHDPAHDLLLEPLDLLRVPRRRAEALPRVEIEGALRQPGSFECTRGLRASDLIALAGGTLPDALQEAELLRPTPRGGLLDLARYRLDLRRTRTHDPRHDPYLREGDRLVIRRLARVEVQVEVSGQVPFPGSYTFPAGARISDLIAAAGGALPEADLRATVFTRQSVRELQLQRFRHLLERNRRSDESALEGLARDGHRNEAAAGQLSLQQSRQLLERMSRDESSGRVVVPFLRPGFPGSPHDLVLEPGDRLIVKRRQETVSVIGLVFNPATFVAEPGLSVEEVLDRAGGLLEDADEERIYVVRADGNVESMTQRRDPLELESELFPGDVVLVPRRPMERGLGHQLADGLALTRQAAEIGLILGKIASPNSGVQLNSTIQSGDADLAPASTRR